MYEIASNIALEREKGEDSFYYPFLNVLPEDVSYMPALWEDDKLDLIKGTTVHDDVLVSLIYLSHLSHLSKAF